MVSEAFIAHPVFVSVSQLVKTGLWVCCMDQYLYLGHLLLDFVVLGFLPWALLLFASEVVLRSFDPTRFRLNGRLNCGFSHFLEFLSVNQVLSQLDHCEVVRGRRLSQHLFLGHLVDCPGAKLAFLRLHDQTVCHFANLFVKFRLYFVRWFQILSKSRQQARLRKQSPVCKVVFLTPVYLTLNLLMNASRQFFLGDG